MEFFGLEVQAWQIYLTIGLILCAGEMFAPGFVLLPMGIGFILTSAFAYFVDGNTAQLIFLAIAEAVMIFIFIKFIGSKRYRSEKASVSDGMIGQIALVTQEIDNVQNTGTVKLYGDRWRALSEDGSPIPMGESVTIQKIDGNKVIVIRKEN